MTKHIYLHIGMPKTGTSSLQDFLYLNKKKLEEKRIGFFVVENATRRQQRANAGFLLTQLESDLAAFTKYANKHETLILSEELFWLGGIEKKHYWEEMNTTIQECVNENGIVQPIVYLRRQDEWVLSMWKEWMTHPKPYTDSFEEMLQKQIQNGGLDYYHQLKKIENVFGKENMIIRIYDRKDMVEGDIRYDFFHAIHQEWKDEYVIYKNANQSVTLDVANALRLINKGIISYESSDPNRGSLRSNAKLYSKMFPEKERVHMLGEEEIKNLLSQYEECNKKISKEYLNGKPLFDDPTKSYKKWQRKEEEVTKIANDIIRLSKTSNELQKKLWNM